MVDSIAALSVTDFREGMKGRAVRDSVTETLVSTTLRAAFPSLGHRLRLALHLCPPALDGLSPTVDRCGSAVKKSFELARE